MQHKQYASIDGKMILPWDETCIFLSGEDIDYAWAHIVEACHTAKASALWCQSNSIPDGAITECQESHHAANTQQGDSPDNHKYQSKGLMGAICQHDTPLFMCDIQTPGEQQHYPIALIIVLFKELPPNATISLLYDIRCMLNLSISKVCF